MGKILGDPLKNYSEMRFLIDPEYGHGIESLIGMFIHI